jgi:ABC-type bacteriocin/lantibiotic exporter with double-glycine peptidase domain
LLHVILSILLSITFFSPSLAQVARSESSFPPRSMIENVPHVWQLGAQCGPASMAMVLNYWGIDIGQNTLAQLMGTVTGTSSRMMAHYPETIGLKVENYSGSMARIAENISRNRPVIVMQWLNYRDKQEGKVRHYRVVTGYDWEKELMYMNDPNRTGHSRLDFSVFQDLWDTRMDQRDSKNWMLVICKP